MSKIVKYGLIGVGAVVGLIALLLVAVVIFVDPNDYKDDITAAVNKQTGRELVIAGDLELSVFPWLGVSLGAAQLSNAQGFGDVPFARVENINLKVKLLPLLSKRVEMQTIQIHGLQAQLVTLPDGRTNWEDLGQASGSAQSESSSASPSGQSGGMPLAALAIGGVDIEDARLDWDDRQAGQHIVVENLNLNTGEVSLDGPVDVTLTTDIRMTEPALASHVDFSGTIVFDLNAQRYQLDDMTLAVNAKGDSLPVSPLIAELSADVEADLAQQHIALNALSVKILDLALQGQLSVSRFKTSLSAQGKITLDNFSPRALLATLGIAVPETSDESVLSNARLAVEFSGSDKAAMMGKLAVVLDDTTLTGTASVKNFQQPEIEFDVMLDEIDADRYLPPESDTPPPTPSTAAAGATQLPLDMLRDLNVTGQLKAGKLKIARARVSEVVLGFKAKGGEIRLHPAQAKLYSGSYHGNIGLDVRTDTPQLSLNEKLEAVAIGPLLLDVLEDELVSGTANVSAVLTAQGVEPNSIMKTLNGTAGFSFLNGAVKGVNLGQMIREANAKIKGQPAPEKTSDDTDFAELTGTATIKQGVVSNQDLNAKTPYLRVNGKGSVDLPKQKIDYLINASVVGSSEGQAGKELEDLRALTIPVKVTGSFAEPKFGLDLKPVLEAKARAKVDAKKAELKEKADEKISEEKAEAKQKLEEKKDEAKDKLKDKLKKLF